MSTIVKKLLDWISNDDLEKFALSVHDKDQIACPNAGGRLYVEANVSA